MEMDSKIEMWSHAIFHRKELENEFKRSFSLLRKIELWLKIREMTIEIDRLRPVRKWSLDEVAH